MVPLRIIPTTTIGGGDLLVEDLRVAADPLLGAQPHAQAVHDAGPQDVRADGVEIGVRVVGQQHPQRALEIARAPIGQRLLALRVGHDRRVASKALGHAVRTSGGG